MNIDDELRDAYDKGPITDPRLLFKLKKLYPQIDVKRLVLALGSALTLMAVIYVW